MSYDDMSISERVVEQVAAETGRDPVKLPHLYDSVEPDALNKLITEMSEGHIRFAYAGLTVIVGSDGNIDLSSTPPSAGSSPSATQQPTD